ncbi:hypothetical protein [Streptomyces anthocyanicus]|uniref:hypothetical protein n=1 Tax=Streptomyces anthocyanicus TaxID=68174 RepID=UPI001874E694|nr:hypothetical protein [Streptomyces anthocyanicus]
MLASPFDRNRPHRTSPLDQPPRNCLELVTGYSCGFLGTDSCRDGLSDPSPHIVQSMLISSLKALAAPADPSHVDSHLTGNFFRRLSMAVWPFDHESPLGCILPNAAA